MRRNNPFSVSQYKFFLEAKLVARVSIFPLRPTNPPSRVANTATRTTLVGKFCYVYRTKLAAPAQSGFFGLHGLSAG